MSGLLVSPFFDSQGGQIKVRFGGTLRVRPTLLTSEDQLEEIRRVSRYAHLQPFLQAHRVGLLINRIRSLATIVRPGSLISEEALDPDDNFLIAICEAGSANSLVTGDQRAGLLERRHIGATEILTAAQFAERYLGWRVQRS